jgi:hypothetical protein
LTIFKHARRQLVAALQLVDAILELFDDQLHRVVILRLDGFERGLANIVLHRELPPLVALDLGQQGFGDFLALLHALGRGGGRPGRSACP